MMIIIPVTKQIVSQFNNKIQKKNMVQILYFVILVYLNPGIPV